MFMAVGIMAIAGCNATDTVSDKVTDSSNEAIETTAEEMASNPDRTTDLDKSDEEDAITEPKEKQYTCQGITITLPEEWNGRCVMVEHECGFSIYQKASYEMDDTTGYVCGFFYTQEPVEYTHGKNLIAYTEGGSLYYLVYPTDIPCDTDDEKIIGEYVRMCQQVPQVKTSLRIEAVGVHYHADEFIFPTSSILPLDQAYLTGLSDNSLWIAKNEIYARHGRQFLNMYLQDYFNRCTWYDGKISANAFSDSLLSQIEKDNLQLLADAEAEYDRQHPYPKRYQASETGLEDLNGDGSMDEISYQVIEQNNGENLCMITVNGETYIANDLSRSESDFGMMNPTLSCFYITDILENDNTLEIAVLDEGASEDPVTYFFQYNGTLSYIGQVPGVPFADISGGLNGFNGEGNITGYFQLDLIETSYVQDSWWYNGSEIVDLDIRWHDFLPSFSHTLYEDLPVYCEQEITSAATVIPAQEEVFFLGTDAEHWILVKGKDGSQGYMFLENEKIEALDKPAEEVFSNLQFSG